MRNHRTSAVTRAVLIAGLALLFCLLAQLVSAGAGSELLIWPASGVAFAFGWRYGRIWTLPCAAGVFAWAMFISRDPLFSITVALASTLGPVVAVHFLRRLGEWKPPEYRIEAIVRFVLVALAGSSLITAAVVTAVFAGDPAVLADGSGAGLHPAHIFLTVWLIDGLGMMLVAPALLAWIDDAVPEADVSHRHVTC
jgi:integral membrane sensor domain MASE1